MILGKTKVFLSIDQFAILEKASVTNKEVIEEKEDSPGIMRKQSEMVRVENQNQPVRQRISTFLDKNSHKNLLDSMELHTANEELKKVITDLLSHIKIWSQEILQKGDQKVMTVHQKAIGNLVTSVCLSSPAKNLGIGKKLIIAVKSALSCKNRIYEEGSSFEKESIILKDEIKKIVEITKEFLSYSSEVDSPLNKKISSSSKSTIHSPLISKTGSKSIIVNSPIHPSPNSGVNHNSSSNLRNLNKTGSKSIITNSPILQNRNISNTSAPKMIPKVGSKSVISTSPLNKSDPKVDNSPFSSPIVSPENSPLIGVKSTPRSETDQNILSKKIIETLMGTEDTVGDLYLNIDLSQPDPNKETKSNPLVGSPTLLRNSSNSGLPSKTKNVNAPKIRVVKEDKPKSGIPPYVFSGPISRVSSSFELILDSLKNEENVTLNVDDYPKLKFYFKDSKDQVSDINLLLRSIAHPIKGDFYVFNFIIFF